MYILTLDVHALALSILFLFYFYAISILFVFLFLFLLSHVIFYLILFASLRLTLIDMRNYYFRLLSDEYGNTYLRR